MLNILYILGAAQGAFLFLCLFIKKGVSGKIFSAIMLFFSYEIFCEYIYINYGWQNLWPLFSLKESIGFIYGPVFLLYILTITNSLPQKRNKVIIFFVPFFLSILAESAAAGSFYLKLSPGFLSPDKRGISAFREITIITRTLLTPAYLVLSFLCARSYVKIAKNYFSDTVKLNTKWLYMICSAGVLIWASGAASSFIFLYLPVFSVYSAEFFFILLTALMYASGYLALTQPELYSIIISPWLRDCAPAKYAKNSLSAHAAESYIKIIELCFTNDRMHLDPELSLPLLSEKTGIPPHHISQVINEKFGMNFYTLVNKYRVEHAAGILSSESGEVSIISICYRSGFNSKSVFNRIFKQMTGLTPSEFKKKSDDKRSGSTH